jgi:integrating conjugative element protein (TIGR03757 family)
MAQSSPRIEPIVHVHAGAKNCPTRRHVLRWGLLCALPCLGAAGQAQQLNPFTGITAVEVFCNSAMLIEPIVKPPFSQTIHRMDALAQALASINPRIPQSGIQAARQWALDHQAQLKRILAPAAAATANAINRANYYRINRLPAIVINQRSLIYGVTDVAEAITRYQAHQAQGHEGR